MLAPWEKSNDKPRQHIKNQRYYFTDKGPYSQNYGFSSSQVWLRVPWSARRPNQSILKEISPEYSLEGLMLKLNLQYFAYLMQRTDSLKKTLMLGKIESRRRRWQHHLGWHHQLDGHEFEHVWELAMDREAWSAAVCGAVWLRLNWTEMISYKC